MTALAFFYCGSVFERTFECISIELVSVIGMCAHLCLSSRRLSYIFISSNLASIQHSMELCSLSGHEQKWQGASSSAQRVWDRQAHSLRIQRCTASIRLEAACSAYPAVCCYLVGCLKDCSRPACHGFMLHSAAVSLCRSEVIAFS